MKYLAYSLIFIAAVAHSQTVDIEKTYAVSKDAQKGFIHSVESDDAKQQLNFTYRVRAKKNQAKFINYTFDYDFNMINQSEEIVDFEKEIPAKYKPKKYRGEDYEKEGLYVEPNMMGTLVMKRKVTHFHWNWFTMGYGVTTSVEGKLKAKTDDDNKLFYYYHIEDNNEGTAMILTGEKGTKESPVNQMMHFHFLKYDINLTKLADVSVNFETPQIVIANWAFQNESDNQSDYVAVFATTKVKNYVGGKNLWGQDPTEYTYVRVSYDGKLIDRIKFNSPNSIWRIDEFVKAKDNSIYFYGPSNDEKSEYFQSWADASSEKMKWPRFQLAKVSNGKMEFTTSTSMDDFKAQLKAQPDGKKGDPYNGRRVAFTEAIVSPTNEIILSGQNYSLDRNAKGQVVGRAYEDLLMFHFDATGKLVSQYTMNKKQKGIEPDEQNFEFSADGKTMYWSYFDNVDSKQVKELDFVVDKPLGVPKMAKINLTTGTFDKYTEYGKGENFVHYNTLNYVQFKQTNKVAFLGEDKKGSTLWFVRVNLDK
jgi:hypothetical protein